MDERLLGLLAPEPEDKELTGHMPKEDAMRRIKRDVLGKAGFAKKTAMKFKLSAKLLIAAAVSCTLFVSAAAYTVINAIYNPVDTGGRCSYVIGPEPEDHTPPPLEYYIEGDRFINVTYEEAAEYLGRDFRLPTVYIEHYEHRFFYVCERHLREAVFDSMEVDVYLCSYHEPHMTSMMFQIQRRSENAEPYVIYVEDAVIDEFDIAGTTVYRFLMPDSEFHNYSWEHDGISYTFSNCIKPRPNGPTAFTEEQCVEIIRSMIE